MLSALSILTQAVMTDGQHRLLASAAAAAVAVATECHVVLRLLVDTEHESLDGEPFLLSARD